MIIFNFERNSICRQWCPRQDRQPDLLSASVNVEADFCSYPDGNIDDGLPTHSSLRDNINDQLVILQLLAINHFAPIKWLEAIGDQASKCLGQLSYSKLKFGSKTVLPQHVKFNLQILSDPRVTANHANLLLLAEKLGDTPVYSEYHSSYCRRLIHRTPHYKSYFPANASLCNEKIIPTFIPKNSAAMRFLATVTTTMLFGPLSVYLQAKATALYNFQNVYHQFQQSICGRFWCGPFSNVDDMVSHRYSDKEMKLFQSDKYKKTAPDLVSIDTGQNAALCPTIGLPLGHYCGLAGDHKRVRM